MSGFVVDASVAVKWLVKEPLFERAAQLLAQGQPLIAPALLYAEVANALWAKVRRGSLADAGIREALDLLAAAPIDVPASMKELAPPAARLARDLDHPVYDCIYLALAIREQRPMVTADRRFHDIVRAHPYLASQIVHLEDAS